MSSLRLLRLNQLKLAAISEVQLRGEVTADIATIFATCLQKLGEVVSEFRRGLVVKLAYHASLSRRRSPVRIRSGPPK